MRVPLLAAVLACLPFTPSANELLPLPTDRIWSEVVVSVRDTAPFEDFLVDAGGWQVLERGEIAQAQLDQWGLPEEASGTQVLLGDPRWPAGYIRFYDIDGVAQEVIRPAAQPWDTGGPYSIMVWSKDSAIELYEAALARGWTAQNEPMQFDFGDRSLRNVVIRAPDGVNFAVYQRIRPPLEGWDGINAMGPAFNSMTMVADQPAELAFWREIVGYETWFEGDYIDPAPTATNFGIPVNFADQVTRRAGILYKTPGEMGRIEPMHWVEFEGRHLGDRVRPPNLGIWGVRHPVSDLDAWITKFEEAGFERLTDPAEIELPPFGMVRSFAVKSPNGVMTGFFEVIED